MNALSKECKKFRQIFAAIPKTAGRFLLLLPVLLLCTVAAVSSDAPLFGKAESGDINGDGVISLSDVAYILSYCAALSDDYPKSFPQRADLDGDGQITAHDAKIAQSRIHSSVIIQEEELTEPTTVPLIQDKLTTDDAGSPDEAVPVIADNNGYNVISNQKMYIYPDMSQVMQMRNTFIIVTFGWGHGVGMSQHGAVGLARAGYSYIQIVQHYYNGVVIMKEQPPKTVRCGGRNVDTVEMLARIIQQEISGITKKDDPLDRNALRAQAVAAYSNMKYSDYSVSGCSYVSSYNSCRDDVKSVAAEIAGQYIQYNGEVVYAYYSACSAGVAATYQQVWGNTSRDMSYLTNSTSYYDCYTSGYITAEAYSIDAMRNCITSYDPSIRLSADPANWIHILTHDDAVNENIGYVSAMQIGDRTLSNGAGMIFRDKVMKYNIKSPCFAIIYNGQYL